VELVDFLRARLDEDEALAREAPPGPWHIGNAVDPTQPCNVHTFPGARMVADGLNWLVAEHIARHDPARVLREIASDRALLAEYAAVAEMDTDDAEPEFAYGRAVGLGIAVRHRALKYANHPDYKRGWRP
jgi:hypothetical protein